MLYRTTQNRPKGTCHPPADADLNPADLNLDKKSAQKDKTACAVLKMQKQRVKRPQIKILTQ